MASPTQGIQLSKVSPSFLHANSTSHTWTFSAIAELIDNAYDPDVNASQLWIDKYNINNKVCLSFVDNGNGMEPHKLLRMLSFGFCEKVSVGGHKPIGQYGNGFKSGSMRLGRDALVFTRTNNTMSVGMLSQNYLEAVKEETVLVPIVTWKLPQKIRSTSQGTLNSLRAILKYSIFRTERSLLDELASLEMLKTGTKIIIYNLKRGNDGKLELDFESDPVDIRNPESHEFDYSSINRPLSQYSPEYRRSLREYGSILFLKPRMKIILRGKKIQTKLISKSLSHTETDIYRPTWLPKPILLTFGFSPNKNDHNTENYGVLMYHRNRLIKAYEKVGLQRQANELGVGVVGVVEVDFLDPIHNKQDFKRTDRYNSFMTSLGTKLNDYWNEKCGTSSSGKSNSSTTAKPLPFSRVFSSVAPEPDWLWVQCDNCLKWRRLPTGIGFRDLPEKWYCHMNPDASHNRCDVEEEPEDEDEALRRPSYEKTFKKAQEEKKKRKQIEEFQKQQEKDSQLLAMRRELERREEELKKVSAEVSSSTENKPSSTELSRAQKALEASIQKQKAQEKIIRQLQTQKSQIETRQVEIMRAAEGLQLVQRRNEALLDSSWSPVSSTSSANRLVPGSNLQPSATNKRVGDEQNVEDVPGIKRIKTEDGNFITVTLNEDAPVVPDLAARRQRQKENPNNAVDPATIIDLTSEEEDTNTTTTTTNTTTNTTNTTTTTTNNNNNNNTSTNNNNIPVGGKSTEVPIDVEDNPLHGKSNNIPSSPLTIISDKENANVISVDANEVNAVPKTANGSATKNNLNINNKAENSALKDELNKTKIKLEELRENVKRLIEIIVPNIDFGEHKIDDVVVEMIRINSQVNSS